MAKADLRDVRKIENLFADETAGWTVPWMVECYEGAHDLERERLALTSHGYVTVRETTAVLGLEVGATRIVTYARPEIADSLADLGADASALEGRPLTVESPDLV
jgi:hypothetical protein